MRVFARKWFIQFHFWVQNLHFAVKISFSCNFHSNWVVWVIWTFEYIVLTSWKIEKSTNLCWEVEISNYFLELQTHNSSMKYPILQLLYDLLGKFGNDLKKISAEWFQHSQYRYSSNCHWYKDALLHLYLLLFGSIGSSSVDIFSYCGWSILGETINSKIPLCMPFFSPFLVYWVLASQVITLIHQLFGYVMVFCSSTSQELLCH